MGPIRELMTTPLFTSVGSREGELPPYGFGDFIVRQGVDLIAEQRGEAPQLMNISGPETGRTDW